MVTCWRQQRSRAVAQHLGQRVGKSSGCKSWKPLVSVTAYHSFGEEVEARIPALVPSSTFEHSSSARASARMQVSRSSGCSFVRRSSANSVVSDSPIRRRCTPILFPAILGLQLGGLNKVG